MSFAQSYLKSSIGKKQVMAITGFGLIGFAGSHLLGNSLLFVGPAAFNKYAYTLMSNPLIYVAEVALLSMFLLHIILGLVTVVQNKAARDVPYYGKKKSTGRGETFASKTMPYTGIVLLIFIILHLINFKYGSYYTTVVDGVQMRDLYRTVIEYFANPFYTAWYVFAMICFGIHTTHGFWSMTQTWGLSHPKYTPIIKSISSAYGLVVGFGFSALAVYCYFQN